MGGSSAQPADLAHKYYRPSALDIQAGRRKRIGEAKQLLRGLHKCCAEWQDSPEQREQVVRLLIQLDGVLAKQPHAWDIPWERALRDDMIPTMRTLEYWDMKHHLPADAFRHDLMTLDAALNRRREED